MLVRHVDRKLERLEVDADYTANFDKAVVRAFRKLMQIIRSAADERAFYAMHSLHYEKLKGQRSHQRSMRLNDQFRLVLQIDAEHAPKVVVVIAVQDYH